MEQADSNPVLWTIGHSTRPLEEFIELLSANRIEIIADVRRYAGSRRHPQFGKENLKQSLGRAGIGYVHFPELGGRRATRADSPNVAWRSKAFRGYADYMMTAPFESGIERLIAVAAGSRTALMCAEALWWRCHRGLIADYLKVRGYKVFHIVSKTKVEEHPFTSAARIVEGALSYSLPD